MRARFIACGLAALAATHSPANAQQCSARSPAHTLALIELYTSEGCDSCPPADRWLRTLAMPGPPRSMVPLAFHVDYWDYIGWKDPYAKPQYAARQREIAALSGSSFVYTPQVVMNGRDHRRWGSKDFLADVTKTNSLPARAMIELSMSAYPDGRIEARATAEVPGTRDRDDAVLLLAIYQHGLSTLVTAGENRGKTLPHDFVTRVLANPVVLGQMGKSSSTIKTVIPAATSKNAGIAAFVQNQRNGDVLQAYSMPLCQNN